jgi:fluoride exporter
MKPILLVGLGGSIGSVLRYLVQVCIGRYVPLHFPLGTFLINISGSLFLGLLYGLSVRHDWLNMDWKLFLMTGICGGFTTFSGYSFEGLALLKEGQYLYFTLYIAGSVLLGLGATALGYVIAK